MQSASKLGIEAFYVSSASSYLGANRFVLAAKIQIAANKSKFKTPTHFNSEATKTCLSNL
jgi:hypothetical protein